MTFISYYFSTEPEELFVQHIDYVDRQFENFVGKIVKNWTKGFTTVWNGDTIILTNQATVANIVACSLKLNGFKFVIHGWCLAVFTNSGHKVRFLDYEPGRFGYLKISRGNTAKAVILLTRA